MWDGITKGDMPLHGSDLAPENIYRVKRAGEDDSRNTREQFRDTLEEQKEQEKEKESSEREGQNEAAPETPVTATHNWQNIHDDIILSESAKQLMDQAAPAEPGVERAADDADNSTAQRINLTA